MEDALSGGAEKDQLYTIISIMKLRMGGSFGPARLSIKFRGSGL
jgi:hypothetical protein